MSLCTDFDPISPYEFLVKALVFLVWGKRNGSVKLKTIV